MHTRQDTGERSEEAFTDINIAAFDIVHISMENWEGVWRRNQPVAREFARRGASQGRRVLYVGLSLDVSHALRKRDWRTLVQALRPSRLTTVPDAENIFLMNPVKWLPNTLNLGRAFNQWWEWRQIREACRLLEIERPLLWMNPHYALHLVGGLNERLTVYDIGDDWTIPDQKEWLRQLTLAQDKALCRISDVVIVVSEHLQELKRPLAHRLHHIPNGVYAERYSAVYRHTLPTHPLTEDWEHPVLGYTGTLHTGRIDVDLIVQLARHLDRGTIALIGPNHLDEVAMAKLQAEPKIRLIDAVPFAAMPRLMSAFDVCIVPHVVSAFTESLSPLKLYECLASGLPTIATPISGFRDFPDLFYLASDSDAFMRAVTLALQEDENLPMRRQKAARQHSWDTRMDAIEAALSSALIEKEQERAGMQFPKVPSSILKKTEW